MLLASFIIGIIALAVAIMVTPTALQMFFGKPQLLVKTDNWKVNDNTVLGCTIINMPIKKGFLYKLHVVRTVAEDVAVSFQILQSGNRNVIFPRTYTNITTFYGTTAKNVRIPPSVFQSFFPIVMVIEQNGLAFILSDQDKDIPITLGEYIVNIEVVTNINCLIREFIFIVDNKEPYIKWRSR